MNIPELASNSRFFVLEVKSSQKLQKYVKDGIFTVKESLVESLNIAFSVTNEDRNIFCRTCNKLTQSYIFIYFESQKKNMECGFVLLEECEQVVGFVNLNGRIKWFFTMVILSFRSTF